MCPPAPGKLGLLTPPHWQPPASHTHYFPVSTNTLRGIKAALFLPPPRSSAGGRRGSEKGHCLPLVALQCPPNLLSRSSASGLCGPSFWRRVLPPPGSLPGFSHPRGPFSQLLGPLYTYPSHRSPPRGHESQTATDLTVPALGDGIV